MTDCLPSFIDDVPETTLTTTPTDSPISPRPKAVRINGPAIDAIRKRMDVLGEVLAGLEGKPFDWNGAEGEGKVKTLATMCIVLVTASGMRKRDHVLKRGAVPVGRRYYGAPIQRSADLYVLGLQTKPSK
ncbi:hypothetical protein [Magnetospirillum sp. SS-4]|uniref:hypothetical protein n=1 Tax=Magnetospirillum sp. SS-4 TaxID=2681465 RepID=UPI00137EB2D0|nr:hypothetical protein [Magnetospirillum sp. SS-4]CAA7619054.1 hypothetical protein MTBSS4_230046 [Magnetospirillum sp. SS-4]